MRQPVLVDPYVYEGSKRRDVGDYAGQPHALAQIVNAVNLVREFEYLEFFARIPPGFPKFLHDVFKRGKADVCAYVFFKLNLRARGGVAHQGFYVLAHIGGNALHKLVALRVDRRGVEGIFGVAYSEKPCRLFEALRSQTAHVRKLLARLERSVLVSIGNYVGGRS